MHHIFHTSGFILSSSPSREADKLISIYTKDLGLVRARVSGIRKLGSRLRYTLQDFSHVRVDLVRGRDTWRITSASIVASHVDLIRNPASLRLVAQIAKLLERLSPGEEPNSEIFEDLISTVTFLDRNDISLHEQETAELTLVLRILHNLGYIGNTDILAHYLKPQFNPEEISYEKLAKKTILFEINRALKESQL